MIAARAIAAARTVAMNLRIAGPPIAAGPIAGRANGAATIVAILKLMIRRLQRLNRVGPGRGR
jgi:hypothetical protein